MQSIYTSSARLFITIANLSPQSLSNVTKKINRQGKIQKFVVLNKV